MSLIDPAYYIK